MGEKAKANLSGRAALAVSILALVVAMAGGAYALTLGRGVVKTKNIKNGAVSTKKLKNNAVKTPKIANGAVTSSKLAVGATPRAFLRFDSAGAFVPGLSRGVNGVDKTNAPNLACVDLKFTPRIGGATRGTDAGATFDAVPQVNLPAPAALSCPAPFQDAVVQLPGEVNTFSIWAWFD